MEQNKYPDCKIKYKCNDKKGKIKCHRIILCECGYFDKIFTYEQPEIKLFELPKKYSLHIYKINIPIYEQDFLKCINFLYKKDTYKINLDLNIIDAISYLMLNDKILIKSLKKITTKILKLTDCNEKFSLVKQLCENINIDPKYIKGILARVLNLLNSDDKEFVIKNFPNLIPKNIFHNSSFIIDKKIIISSNEPNFVYNGIKFDIYETINRFGDEETGFWIRGIPKEEKLAAYDFKTSKCNGKINIKPIFVEVIFRIYDGLNEPKKNDIEKPTDYYKNKYKMNELAGKNINKFKFPGKIENKYTYPQRVRYGRIIYGLFDSNIAFEFEINLNEIE